MITPAARMKRGVEKEMTSRTATEDCRESKVSVVSLVLSWGREGEVDLQGCW